MVWKMIQKGHLSFLMLSQEKVHLPREESQEEFLSKRNQKMLKRLRQEQIRKGLLEEKAKMSIWMKRHRK